VSNEKAMVMKNINLIPKDYYDKQKLKNFIYRMGAVLALIFSFIVLFVAFVSHKIDVKAQEIYVLNVLINDEKFIESQQIIESIALRKNEIALSYNIALLLSDELNQDIIINTIMKNMSNDIEFVELFYNRQERRVTTMLQVEDKNVIPIFIDNINGSGIINNINIISITNNSEATLFLIEMFLDDEEV